MASVIPELHADLHVCDSGQAFGTSSTPFPGLKQKAGPEAEQPEYNRLPYVMPAWEAAGLAAVPQSFPTPTHLKIFPQGQMKCLVEKRLIPTWRIW